MSERAVEKHIGSVFQKLGLVQRVRRQPPGDGGAGVPRGHRRTRATAAAPVGRAASPLSRAAPDRGTMAAGGVTSVTEVRVLVVDDQEPFRRAMAAVVEETDGFVVVGRRDRRGVARRRRASCAPTWC